MYHDAPESLPTNMDTSLEDSLNPFYTLSHGIFKIVIVKHVFLKVRR